MEKDDNPTHEKIEHLTQDVLNIPSHVFVEYKQYTERSTAPLMQI